MTEEMRTRFKDAPWFISKEDVVDTIIGGAGGVGGKAGAEGRQKT